MCLNLPSFLAARYPYSSNFPLVGETPVQLPRLRLCSSMTAAANSPIELFNKRLKNSIGPIFVEFDTNLGPKVVGEIVELPARRHRQEKCLSLLVDRELGYTHRVGSHFDRATEVECSNDNGAAARVAAKESAAESY